MKRKAPKADSRDRQSIKLKHAFLALALCAVSLGGCANEPRTPFTEAEQVAAPPVGKPSIPYGADVTASAFQDTARHAVVQKGGPFIYLALSGGGGSGA